MRIFPDRMNVSKIADFIKFSALKYSKAFKYPSTHYVNFHGNVIPDFKINSDRSMALISLNRTYF